MRRISSIYPMGAALLSLAFASCSEAPPQPLSTEAAGTTVSQLPPIEPSRGKWCQWRGPLGTGVAPEGCETDRTWP